MTEWPASEKARLEALLSGGAVAVKYSGCELKIVDTCTLKGTYSYERTTLSTDTTEIGDEDDLYAKLPLGALGLEGELKRYGRLAVRTTVAGQMKLTGAGIGDVPHDGQCDEATHLLVALSVGAYKLLAGGQSTGQAKVGIGQLGAGGSATHEEETMREAGDPAACDKGTDTAPDPACRSPLQIFLMRIPHPERDRQEAEAAQAREQQEQERRDSAAAAHTRRSWAYVLGAIGLGAGAAGALALLKGNADAASIGNGGLATGDDIDGTLSRAQLEHGLSVGAFITAGISLAIAIPLFFTSSAPSPPEAATVGLR